MKLDIQIYSFGFSFVFGCLFYFLLDIFNFVVKNTKLLFRIFFSFMFIFIMSILYFLILLFINNGVLHVYFLLMILVGYTFSYKVLLSLFTYFRRK